MRIKMTLASLIVLALATGAGAQNKLSGTAQCSKPDPQHMVQVGDRPNHSFMLSQSKCTWSKPYETAGIEGKETLTTAFDEISGNGSSTRGFFFNTMANGDKQYGRYQGKATLKDGMPQSLEGTWSSSGGTGKFKGMKGKGTYKAKGNPDGTVTYEIESEYELPK